jgi:hypothetical protein
MSTEIVYKNLERVERGELPKRICAAMTASHRFWINARGVLLFESSPDTLVPLLRVTELVAVLRDSGAVSWAGDAVPETEWPAIAMAVFDNRWRFKPASSRHVYRQLAQAVAR